MEFIKKHRIWSRFIGITLSIAILIACVPLFSNNLDVAADEIALPNLVAGGDFEGGTTLPTGFEVIEHEYYKGPFERYSSIQGSDKPTGFTGNNLKLTWSGKKMETDFESTGKGNIFVFYTVKVPVESGNTYDIGFNTYTAASDINMRFSYGTSKWNGSLSWADYGTAVLRDKKIGTFTTPYSTRVTATSNELWLLFGIKDARSDTTTDVSVYFDDITVTPVTEYVADGSFESGNLNNWNKSSANSNFSVVKASDENITACDNEYVLKINGASNYPYVGREGSNSVAVTSGSTYQFSFYVYRVSSNSEAVFKLGNASKDTAYNHNGSQQFLNAGGIGNSATGTWIKVTRTFTATDNTVKLYFVSNSAGKDTVYIDNVSIKKLLTVTATAQEGGSVSGLPTGDIYSGDKIDLTATPNDGYEFDGWYQGSEKISSDVAYSFIAYKDVALTAKFKAKNFELIKNGSFETGDYSNWSTSYASDFSVVNATDEAAGTKVDGDKILKLSASASGQWHTLSQKVTIEANTDYVFSFWYYRVNDGTTNKEVNYAAIQAGNANNNYSGYFQLWLNYLEKGKWVKVTVPFNSGDHTVFNFGIAAFKGTAYADNISLKKVVKVTTTAEGGTISGVPDTVLQGDKLTVTAVPNAGYAFDGWYKNGIRVADTASYTFYASADTTLQARFETTDNMVQNGSFETGDFTAWKAHSDFTVINSGADGAPAAKDGSKLVKSVRTAAWNNLNQTCTIEKNTNYVVGFWYYRTTGSNMALKIGNNTADNGFVKESWLNWSWLPENQWNYVTFKFNSGDSTVCKLFLCTDRGTYYVDDVTVRKYVNVKATAESGGKISGLTEDWAYFDTPISLTATAEAGFTFDGWYENNEKISSDATLQFNATADRNIVAKFAALDNYIVDGGFEQSALVSLWSHSGASNPRLTISTAEHYEGDQSAFLATQGGWAWSRYKLTVKKNTNYMATVMIKVPEGDYTDPLFKVLSLSDNSTNMIDGADPSNGNFFCRDTNSAIKAGGGWQKGTFTFNSGDNDTLYLLMTGNSKVNCYIDNLVVGEAFTATIFAGENGKAQNTTVMGLKNTTGALVAIPDTDYMVEGWYVNGQKVSEDKTYNHLFTEDVNVELKFTISDLPVMTRFDLAKLWCAENNNLLSDSGFEKGTGEWNTASFIKNGVLDVVDDEGNKVLYFNPDGTGRQTVYFPVSLEGNTEYMFSAKVKGKYYSATNLMDMNFGIMTDEGEFITMRDANMGGYRDERPNITFTKSITPPSWDNNWHRRGITFKTIAPTTVWIAVSGNLSEAYLDDFILCKFASATEEPVVENIAKTTSYTVAADKMGCDDSNNLVENYNFDAGVVGWEDGYGWNGLYSGVYIGDSGNKNNSLFMRSTTGYADRHYYIQWIDVKPNTDYTFSLATAATSFEANFGLLAEGAKRYNKLAIWTVEGNSEWTYNAITFNSNDSTRVGIYVMDGGRVTALDEIRIFETSKATALTNKLEGKADLPEEYIPPVEDTDDSGDENTSDNTQNDDSKDEDENTTTKKTKKKKVVKVLKNNKADTDYTLWWILGGVGAAILLAGIAVLIIILVKKKRKKAE